MSGGWGISLDTSEMTKGAYVARFPRQHMQKFLGMGFRLKLLSCSDITVQQSKSTFYTAILKIQRTERKNYNLAAGIWISTKYDTDIAELLHAKFGDVCTKAF